MRNSILLLLLFTGLIGCRHDPIEQSSEPFSKSFGGVEDDIARDMIQIGGFIYTVGTTSSFGNVNGSIYWIKTDLDGNLMDEKSIGDAGYWKGSAIIHLSDSNMLIGGTYSADGLNNGVVVYKLNTSGEILNETSIDGPASMSVEDVYELSDSRLLVLGADDRLGHRQTSLITLTSNLDFVSQHLYGGSGTDGGSKVIEEINGDLMIFGFGTIPGHPSQDFYLMRLNADQDSLWGKYYGGDDYEEPQEFLQTADKDYLLIGHFASNDPIHDMYIVKVNGNGDMIWEREFGGAAHDGAEAALINSKGQYVFVARSMSFGGNQNAYMVVTD